MEMKKQQAEKVERTMNYQCPMKCEGSKTYDQEGNCPVCNMKLMPFDSKKHRVKLITVAKITIR